MNIIKFEERTILVIHSRSQRTFLLDHVGCIWSEVPTIPLSVGGLVGPTRLSIHYSALLNCCHALDRVRESTMSNAKRMLQAYFNVKKRERCVESLDLTQGEKMTRYREMITSWHRHSRISSKLLHRALSVALWGKRDPIQEDNRGLYNITQLLRPVGRVAIETFSLIGIIGRDTTMCPLYAHADDFDAHPHLPAKRSVVSP